MKLLSPEVPFVGDNFMINRDGVGAG